MPRLPAIYVAAWKTVPTLMFRLLLIPFSLLYSAIIRLRNLLYDHNLLKSTPSSLPTICVGNLAVGGTGKTPHSEYLLKNLNGRLAYVSRGYKRHTKGLYVADANSTSLDLGDEAYQIHVKFPNVTVVVDSDRHRAVNYLKTRGDIDLVVLDDAFQHRNIRATKNIVLTDYATNPRRELMLPAGRMRDSFSSMRRADIIVVTKSPENLTDSQIQQKTDEVRPKGSVIPALFTSLKYGTPYNPITHDSISLNDKRITLFSGIENPTPLEEHLRTCANLQTCLKFPDHHPFTPSDITKILSHDCDYYVTTEKDFARLSSNATYIASFQNRLAVIPIEISDPHHQLLQLCSKTL